jgi:peptide/nickel transport system permease protein
VGVAQLRRPSADVSESARAPDGFTGQMWWRVTRNRLTLSLVWILIAITVVVVLVPLLLRISPEAVNPANALSEPSSTHWLGTDEVGRDTFTRLLYACRISMAVGFTAMAISIVLGSLIGAVAGFYGGATDIVLMRITDAMMSLPAILLLLVILVVFGSGLDTVIMVIGVTSWMGAARIVRAEVLQWKASEFVEAAQALGAGALRILAVGILPNVAPSIIVTATLGVARAILLESALSYLGLGIQPPTPSLGNMLSNAQSYLWHEPLQALWPGLLILIIVLTCNLLGDGLRDALDPQTTSA